MRQAKSRCGRAPSTCSSGFVTVALGTRAMFKSFSHWLPPQAAPNPNMLADFALRFPDRPELRIELRYAVLGLLVDAPQPRTVAFWKRILKQDPNTIRGPCFLACSLQDRGSPSRCFPRCRTQSVTVWPRPSSSTSLGTTCRRGIGRVLSSKCRTSSASADPNLRVRSKNGRMVAQRDGPSRQEEDCGTNLDPQQLPDQAIEKEMFFPLTVRGSLRIHRKEARTGIAGCNACSTSLLASDRFDVRIDESSIFR